MDLLQRAIGSRSYIIAYVSEIPQVLPYNNLDTFTSDVQSFTEKQINIVRGLEVAFSTVSVGSAMLSFYWFKRMRRCFRHDLIMFLIQSDMFKALIAMISGIYVSLQGSVAISPAFCTTTGFLLAFGIEASDFAVLMIALHSVLNIYNASPRASTGEGGLYPYRHVAYSFWILFPVLMASLAFLNRSAPYVFQGGYCYLPVRPVLYRCVLSWAPRYIIFITIIAIYISMYVYVQYRLRDLRRDSVDKELRDSPASSIKLRSWRPQKYYTLPPTPPLAYHGLISVSRSPSIARPDSHRYSGSLYNLFRPGRSRLSRVPTVGSTALSTRTISLDRFPSQSKEVATGPQIETISLKEFGDVSFRDFQLTYPLDAAVPTTWSTSRRSTWGSEPVPHLDTRKSARQNAMNIFDFLRIQPHHPSDSSVASTRISQIDLLDSRGRTLAAGEKARIRSKIHRQSRYLFIYPLFYMTMWLCPFILHIMQYKDKYAMHPPFILACIAGVMQASQCAVDCWLFSTREKPWRHIPNSGGGFWESFKFWEFGRRRWRERFDKGPGKSRFHMSLDARQALRRREEEISARKLQEENLFPSAGSSRDEKHWWEELGGDGTMSANEDSSSPKTAIRLEMLSDVATTGF